jgi:hypothetical protein
VRDGKGTPAYPAPIKEYGRRSFGWRSGLSEQFSYRTRLAHGDNYSQRDVRGKIRTDKKINEINNIMAFIHTLVVTDIDN